MVHTANDDNVRQRGFILREGLLEGNDPKRFELDFNMLHSGF